MLFCFLCSVLVGLVCFGLPSLRCFVCFVFFGVWFRLFGLFWFGLLSLCCFALVCAFWFLLFGVFLSVRLGLFCAVLFLCFGKRGGQASAKIDCVPGKII